MFNLLVKEFVNTIELSDKVRISDPCYDMNTWCAGTLENVLSGTYHCFTQRVDQGDWGVRIENIEVRHKDWLHIDPTEEMDIYVGVDSGQCGIYDLEYFRMCKENAQKDDIFYGKVCDLTEEYIENPLYVPFNKSSFWKKDYEKVEFVMDSLEEKMDSLKAGLILLKAALGKTEDLTGDEKEFLDKEEKEYLETKRELHEKLSWELEEEYYKAKNQYRKSIESSERIFRFSANTLDNKCLVSSSGDGDGSYTCFVGRNEKGKIVSIKIDYYHYYKEEE